MVKGIILAGGSGTRLYPITKGVSKQLLPVYDKPMIYYPLSVLMIAGIKEVLIISTPEYIHSFEKLLGTGKEIGLKLSYKAQPKPGGLAQAFIIGEDFIGADNVCLILGDNIFHGQGLTKTLQIAINNLEDNKSTIFGYYVNDPERYGVVTFNEEGAVTSIIEKPKAPRSNYAVVGLYFYTNDVVQIAKNIKPSPRGELEITSVNQIYLKLKKLNIERLSRGFTWLDTGTHESLMQASRFVETIEKRQGLKVACLEEIAFRLKYIDANQLRNLAYPLKKNGYGQYLLNLIN